jgi:hypothetical protein
MTDLEKTDTGKTDGPGGEQITVGNEWGTAIYLADLDRIYKTILQTCKLVGQECIRTMCQTKDNQFGLCMEETSTQRRAVLAEREVNNNCFKEVKDCVSSTNSEQSNYLNDIVSEYDEDFKLTWPGSNDVLIYGEDPDPTSDIKIAKNIWGRCNVESTVDKSNTIIVTDDSVLGWFGKSTAVSCYTGQCADNMYTIFYTDSGIVNNEDCSGKGSSAYERCGTNSNTMRDGGITNVDGSNTDEESILMVSVITNTNLEGGFYYTNGNTSHFTNCCDSKIKDGYENCCGKADGTDMQAVPTGINITSTATTGPSSCNTQTQCCFEYYGSGSSRPAGTDDAYCVPSSINKWTYIATSGSTHLFCLGGLNTSGRENYGEDDKSSDKTCDGTFVTVNAGTGIYSSRLGSSTGTERYLNYFYANENDKPEDKEEHHKLYVYLTTSKSGFCESNKVTSDGYYSTNCDINDRHGLGPKHHVAYCEYGFEINNRNQTFACCSDAGCEQYKFKAGSQ